MKVELQIKKISRWTIYKNKKLQQLNNKDHPPKKNKSLRQMGKNTHTDTPA